ncbi:protein of unknown function [Serratia sp. Tan611]|nr:protein of unknown function [Serratia sp. Tan611]
MNARACPRAAEWVSRLSTDALPILWLRIVPIIKMTPYSEMFYLVQVMTQELRVPSVKEYHVCRNT